MDRSATPDVAKLSRGLRAIDSSTVRLVRLVDELLDLTRLRMGHPIELTLTPTDLVGLVRRTADEFQQMHPERTITIKADGDGLSGEWDAERIERVVANLLSNAVKYSDPDSEIGVSASAESRDGRRWAVLAVSNSGVGIPASEVDRVFDTYYRGTNVSRSISGTGVGLAGARHIVEQHGGAINVESVPGERTTFTVRLPITAST
jgi:signal transduction histidine kinase